MLTEPIWQISVDRILPIWGISRAMILKEFLQAEKLTLVAFAPQAGISVQTLHRYVQGHRFPTAENLLRIRLATDGRVTADDFVDQHTGGALPQAAA